MTELKPCPFCGHTEPSVRGNNIGDFYVMCDCDVEGEDGCGASTSDQRCETVEGAIRRWNTRADPSADLLLQLQGERDGLDRALHQIDPDFTRRAGVPCGYPRCGCEPDAICHIACNDAANAGRLQAAEAQLSEAMGVLEKQGLSVSQSQPSGEASGKPEVFAGLDAETGWLLEGEMPDGSPGWLTLKPYEALWGIALTKQSAEALRFARRSDAEDYYAAHIDEGPLRITAHRWG